MDAGHRSTRTFPGYTTAELRILLTERNLTPDRRAMIEAEIQAREDGRSVPFRVPQL